MINVHNIHAYDALGRLMHLAQDQAVPAGEIAEKQDNLTYPPDYDGGDPPEPWLVAHQYDARGNLIKKSAGT